MTTSGTKTFELDVADYIEEAFERCGLEARTGYDGKTARRSLNLLLAEWANRGINHWTLDTESVELAAGEYTLALGAETIDLLGVVVAVGDTVRKLTRISREDWLGQASPNQSGAPVQFRVKRTIAPSLEVWPIPDVSYTLTYERLVRMDDVTASTQTVDLPFRFYPALAAGLAYYLSMKKNPQLTMQLKAIYEEEFSRAAQEDRDRASFFTLPPRGYRL